MELDKARVVVLDRAEEYYGVMNRSRSKKNNVSTQNTQTLTLLPEGRKSLIDAKPGKSLRMVLSLGGNPHKQQ